MSEARFLHDVFPEITSNHEDGYCVSSLTTKMRITKYYWDWENNIATPALVARGYKVIRWYSSESDSFGPLSRNVDVEKDGVKEVLWYG
jgi:hypothetical protein